MIDDIRQSTGHGIRPICDVLGVPRSSYYHAAQATPTQQSDQHIGELIEVIFKRHRRRYGHRRIWKELADHDVVCAPDRVRRIMRERGLKAIQPKTLRSQNQRRQSRQTLAQHARRPASPGKTRSSLGR